MQIEKGVSALSDSVKETPKCHVSPKCLTNVSQMSPGSVFWNILGFYEAVES